MKKHITVSSLTRLLAAALSVTAVSAAFGQATLQFSATTYSVSEAAGAVTLNVQRLGDTNTAVSVDYATADGTATNGLKYTAVSGPLAFGAGETTKGIVVPILNNGFVDGTRYFRVILSNPTNAILGTRTNVTVSVADNDLGIQFFMDSRSVTEDAGTVIIAVVRDDDGEVPVTVDVATSDLTAINGRDYTGVTNTLAFGPTERLQCFSVPILNNGGKQPNRNFRLTLSNPTGGTLGTTKTSLVTIVDDDQGFQFDSASYTVAEDAGVALITVLRGTDETNAAVTVDLATSNLTASHGADYTGLTNTLAFAPGERRKVIAVPILNDGVKEYAETFRVTLSNPTGGAGLGSPTTTTVSLLDNDPGVGFELTGYTNAWNQGDDFTVTVLRGNDGALGLITVDYSTSDLTAKAGKDYQAVSGTLAFQENETVKNLVLPLLQGRAAAGTKSFRVSLSNATPGVTLGTATTTVVIGGDAVTVAPPFDTALTIRREWGVNVLAWAGGGPLQRADKPTGPWRTLLTATNAQTVQSPVPTTFYRVTRPRSLYLYVPSSYDGQTPMPLILLLHGYSWSPERQEAYMQLRPLAESRGFLYCCPDGLPNAQGERSLDPFDEATDLNVTLGWPYINDVAYLRSLIEEVGRHFALDRKRVYLIGHSAGGFMAYTMAVKSADLIAGIASLAGTMYYDFSQCAPSAPVSILHINGTADASLLYWGGAVTFAMGFWANLVPFPGPVRTVQVWAGYNGATGPVTDPAPTLDLTTDVAGLDTMVTRYTNAPPGGAVELWTINGGGHVPTLSSEFSPRVIDWLLAHPKP